ncbi:MAG: filamentous hemagglutinin family protein [Thermodesulfobacteriota bacterium]
MKLNDWIDKSCAWAWLVAISGVLVLHASAWAGPTIPGLYSNYGAPAANALPVPKVGGTFEGSWTRDDAINKLTVSQEKEKAIYEWDTFNIGEKAWTHFDQKGNKDWVALNRIYDASPSLIFGKLSADGKVYLVNQNGILFGPSSKVNAHALVASSLNIKDSDFKNGILNFKLEDYAGFGGTGHLSSTVSNHGVIETDELGEVFLLAPTVENNGTIITPVGQIGLAAGTEISIYRDTATGSLRSGLFVHVKAGAGEATNYENGWILADAGLAGMYGRVVNQEGVIRAVTAVKKKGEIELWASDKVSTGAKSITSTMVSDSPEKVHESFEFQPGEIRLQGLDPVATNYDPVKVVEHRGIMEAPSGLISITAKDRVYLESGSRMDVSGRWVDSPAEGNVIETTLNSVELRDDYGQKEGLLKGLKIKFDSYMGSAFGDVSGALTSREVTALEQATKGGTITIKGPSEQGQGLEEIVIKKDALISFAGGGIRYAPGQTETTTLKAGNHVYDISELPDYTSIDGVLGLHQTFHERYGITEEYWGLYAGGANDIKNFSGERVEGKDAGTVQLMAKRIVLDGSLDGSVLKGPFQTEKEEPTDEQGNQTATGRKMPSAGTLQLGVSDTDGTSTDIDYFLHEVVVKSEVAPLPSTFKPDDKLPGTGTEALKTYLSSQTLSAANLGALKILTNTKFATEKDAVLSLQAGAQLSVTARAIEHRGEIRIPGGSLSLLVRDNETTGTLPVVGDGRVFLAPGSKLVAAGERIDNFQSVKTGGGLVSTGHLDGGSVSITVQDSGEGVIVSRNALVDVSGGYLIDEKGAVTGGDAGSLSIALKSDGKGVLILDGDLRGHSIPGKKGGTLSLLAKRISVEPSGSSASAELEMGSPIPAALIEKFVLAQDRLNPTGFTNIELLANYGLEVLPGVKLFPSTSKLAQPVALAQHGYAGSVLNHIHGMEGGKDGLVTVEPEYIGTSSITLKAGQDDGLSDKGANDAAMLEIGAQSLIGVGPAGTIKMEAPGIRMAGHLDAPAGKIDLKATGSNMDLTLLSGAVLSAKGYNKPDSKAVMKGYPVGYTPVAGGEVNLEASQGSLVLEEGSLVDVSGSAPVKTYTGSSVLGALPSEYTVASEPGSVSLGFFNDLVLHGTLDGHARMKGLKGGALTLSKKDTAVGLVVSSEDIARFQSQGFDALTLQSKKSLEFSGHVDARLARSLTLDAPEILGQAGQRVAMSAPWVRLVNSPDKYDTNNDDPYTFIPAAASAGTGSFALSGDWIDIDGSMALSGFAHVLIEAGHDIRLSDRNYEKSNSFFWEGMLKVPGDLTLQADRIYPTTLSEFTFKAADTGKVTILSLGEPDKKPVYSAGGSLSIEAGSIEHRGYLAAPLGRIQLKATAAGGRVYLSEESVTTVAGEVPVKYGDLAGEFWQVLDRAATGGATDKKDVTAIPAKSVDISGDEVIVKEGALVDLSGGGSVFTYEFLSSPSGSENPLTKTGRYVILPDNSVVLPGEAIYLEGGNGIAAGTYSLLPIEFAFLPGAMILTDLSKAGQGYTPGQTTSLEGYPVVAGYTVIQGTDVKAAKPAGYSIRRTEDVLKEGYFTVNTLAGGDAGSLSISGDTTVLGGIFRIKATDGYEKGKVTLAGKRIEMGEGVGVLPAGFDFSTPVPSGLKDKLLIQPGIFDDMDLKEIVLGDTGRTEVVEIQGGSSIQAERVTLKAKDEIILRTGAEIHAVSEKGGGVASLLVPDPDSDGTGNVILEPGSLVHASDEVVLGLKTIDYRGEIQVDHSAITLESKEIFFVPEAYAIPASPDGFYIRQSHWDKFRIFETIGLRSDTSINFLGDFNLAAAEMLSLDASRIAGTGTDPVTDPGADVILAAPIVRLLYSGDGPLTGTGLVDTGTLTLNAAEVRVGRGQVLLDGFSRTEVISRGDTIFQGKGSLTTQGDLNIIAARVTTSYDLDAAGNYQAVDFSVNTGTGAIAIQGNGAAPGADPVPGGILGLTGRRIDISGLLEVASAQLNLNATGSGTDGIFLFGTGRIINRGSDYGPGGSVELRADLGKVELAAGSVIDVSAGGQGNAGSVSLYAPTQGVTLNGSLLGHASGALGGSFSLDTYQIDNFNTIYSMLAAGGFNQEIAMRARTGDVEVGSPILNAPAMRVEAHDLKLVADGGSILVNPNVEIDASGEAGGGRVELYARDLVMLLDDGLTGGRGATISARGTGQGASGGEISLGASESYVVLFANSLLDVSAGEGGTGGVVNLRAKREGNDVLMLPLGGTIRGASGVYAEAFTTYNDTSITTTDINTWKTQTQTYMNNAGTIESRLLSSLVLQNRDGSPGTADTLHLLPGIEIRSTGDLSLANDWDLKTWRFGGEPGILTLRSGGNLTLNASLTDKPNENPSPSSVRDSWAMNLVAGADLAGAEVLAVQRGTGTLAVSNSKAVYTESAPLRFASGGDTNVGLGQILSSSSTWWALKESFNLGTFDGSIEGQVGGTLSLNGGAVLSGTGDIDIRVGGDLLLGKGTGTIPGAILSMGRSTETGTLRYRRQDAGDIRLEVGGNLESLVSLADYAWDFNYSKRSDGGASDWGPSFKDQGSFGTKATTDIRGIAALGGGDIEIHAGGSFLAPAGSFGYVKASRTSVDRVWQYTTEESGKGDLAVYAGGDVLGRFLVMQGDAEIHAMGGMVEYTPTGGKRMSTVLEGFDSRFNLSAQGDVYLGTILNPTLVAGNNLLLYSDEASASIASARGDVFFQGDSPYVDNTAKTTLPPALEIKAAGDIRILNSLTLAPSPTGNLRLIAGGGIDGYDPDSSTMQRRSITMSDVAGPFSTSNPSIATASRDLIHLGDSVPIEIRAGGDIKGLKLFLPKKAEISAGGDIYDLYLGGQNLGSEDLTLVRAGGSIVFPERGSGALQDYNTGFEVAGPGTFMVQAGGNISLGDARVGIRTIGGTLNSKLGTEGSALLVAAGFCKDLLAEGVDEFFEGIREGIREYTSLLVAGKKEEAEQVVQEKRGGLIAEMLGEMANQGSGDILMLNSQISTLSGQDHIFILSSGKIDVGRTTFFRDQSERANTGIYTAGGGSINIFSVGDVNVNESRIMTFMGGDITIWADDGVIKAGRGSKTVVSANPPKVDADGRIVFSPPAVGSGIRTLTFDPDGEGGPKQAPEAGDVYLFAKVIDAGEAGIAGKNLFLGSTTVLNAQNISFTGTGMGVPVSTEGAGNIGALSGAGTVGEASKMTDQGAALASSRADAAAQASKLAEEFSARWVEVKVVAFDTGVGEEKEE